MGLSKPMEHPNTRASFESILTGTLKKLLTGCKEKLGRLSIEMSEWSSQRSSVASTELHSALSGQSSTTSRGQTTVVSEVSGQGAIRVSLWCCFGVCILGADGVILKRGDWEEVLEEGVKTGLALGVGEGAGALVAKSVVPTFARAGVSVVRANAAAGAAMFGVVALWDVAKWAKHDITSVELRQNLTEGAAGAAAGVAAGIAAGAVGGVLLGPVGSFFGAIAGGVAKGFGGAKAGKVIDKAIWNVGEDSVMNSYEFFGWHNVKRGT